MGMIQLHTIFYRNIYHMSMREQQSLCAHIKHTNFQFCLKKNENMCCLCLKDDLSPLKRTRSRKKTEILKRIWRVGRHSDQLTTQPPTRDPQDLSVANVCNIPPIVVLYYSSIALYYISLLIGFGK